MTTHTLNIRLFIKSYCGWCHEAVDWLESRGLNFESIEVISNPNGMHELVKLTGRDMTPSIEVNGEVLADFGVDELELWWRAKGFDKLD
ncbi:MAG: glutaredoxin family protein [Verrucomicrobiota bacterium]|jgi:glutaredoxin 3|nr:glutaredoxin family protein [Verrucomicrobiota bacterium]